VARVDVLREVKSGEIGEWQLCFHWCRYRYDDDSTQYGYRFVWRRAEDGSIQAARGQARIPNFASANNLMQQATDAGWGNRDADELEAAAVRLKQLGCVVELVSGYVGWPNREIAQRANLSQQGIDDAKLIHEWTH
jgi:hypothetical protein